MIEQLEATPTNGFSWQQRLDQVVESMREMSGHTDPQAMVRAYGARMRKLRPVDRLVALSRRDLPSPKYRITRSSMWEEEINPWQEPHRLPVLEGGLMGELLYAETPRIIADLQVPGDDPAADYFAGQRSLVAVPNFDQGRALNMVLLMREQPEGFSPEELPEQVWISNLFGRATHNLVLSDRLTRALNTVDHELKMVADIQRSLLPATLPTIPTLDLAAHYQTSRHAGGDYYDFFPLPGGLWGILIADVSGHGAGAAVLMAIMHTIAHDYPGPPTPAGQLLEFVNRKLATRYTAESGTFVTAFYGIYYPSNRTLRYASAGHNPPRLKRCGDGSIGSLDATAQLPLGILEDEKYEDATIELRPGDQVLFYTDGITEAQTDAGEQFGMERLDQVLGRCRGAAAIIDDVLNAVERFTGGRPADDDRTLLVARVE
jgi:sigma-B regulation protein RsbU (phosphoserine phosphatase)